MKDIGSVVQGAAGNALITDTAMRHSRPYRGRTAAVPLPAVYRSIHKPASPAGPLGFENTRAACAHTANSSRRARMFYGCRPQRTTAQYLSFPVSARAGPGPRRGRVGAPRCAAMPGVACPRPTPQQCKAQASSDSAGNIRRDDDASAQQSLMFYRTHVTHGS